MKLDTSQMEKANLEKTLQAAQVDFEQKQRTLVAELEEERRKSAVMMQDFADCKHAHTTRLVHLEVRWSVSLSSTLH